MATAAGSNAKDFLRFAPRPALAESWGGCLTPDAVDAALAEAKALVRMPGGGWTHWVDDRMVARCALEGLALAVMRWHVERLGSHAHGEPGAEYWVQVRSADEAMSIHWDCDEELKGKTGEHLPPYLATVTYLTSVGTPTLVLPVSADARGRAVAMCPVRTAASAAPVGDAESNLAADAEAGVCDESPALGGSWCAAADAYASFPVAAKHLAFDGRLLHGAPTAEAATDEETDDDVVADRAASEGTGTVGGGSNGSEGGGDALRVTILVNLWLAHRPMGVEVLPEEMVSALESRLPTSALPHAAARASVSFGAAAVAIPAQRALVALEASGALAGGPIRDFSIGSFHHPPVQVHRLPPLVPQPLVPPPSPASAEHGAGPEAVEAVSEEAVAVVAGLPSRSMDVIHDPRVAACFWSCPVDVRVQARGDQEAAD